MTPKALADLLAAAIHEFHTERPDGDCNHIGGRDCAVRAKLILRTPSGLALLERAERAERLYRDDPYVVTGWGWVCFWCDWPHPGGAMLGDQPDPGHEPDCAWLLAAPTHPEEEE